MSAPLNDRDDPIVIACALFNYRELEVQDKDGKLLLHGKRGEPGWKWIAPRVNEESK